MSDIEFETETSTVTIEGSNGSTIDITETTATIEDGQAVEITATSTASILEIPTTTVISETSNSVSTVHISTGDKGETGEGTPGLDGEDGIAATVTIGTTTTSDAGTDAVVTNSGDTTAAIFNFTIPRGNTGAAGENPLTVSASAPADPSLGDLWYQP